jgi:serine/threonine protein kinase
MPAPTTTDDLLELVHKSGLIDAARLAAFERELPKEQPTGPKQLARLLVGAGLITRFQAEQFLLGKWRGFTIGKYKVLERLGAGGAGAVYLCEHMTMRRKAAVKVLPAARSDNPAAVGRFYREARAAGTLEHPNLVRAHDVGEDDGVHYLVMDYVDGANLQEIVARTGPMTIARAAWCIRETARGLEAAHNAGLIHRDVKPGNVIVDRAGGVRVLDLGLARFYHDNTDMLTLKYDENNVLGTADYVSPEQALNSHEVDGRADVYSLGATFYFLLIGQPPFAGGKAAQKLIWHQVRPPTPVRQLRPEIPEEMAAVVEIMLAKNPADRYQTMGEIADALAPWTPTTPPPPAESELPRLSPLALRTGSNPGVGRGPVTPPRSSRPEEFHHSGASTGSVRSPSDLVTPRVLASAYADTATDRKCSRPAAPAGAAPQPPPRVVGNRRAQAVRLAFILILGLTVGLVLRFAALRIWPAAPPEPPPAAPAPDPAGR